MSGTSISEAAKKKNSKTKTQEEILMGFQKLRGEQRLLSNKLTELELDLHEHKLAVDTLKDLDGSRRCFKLVGGILCERTVKDVLPEVQANQEQLGKVIECINQQLVAKGVEINAYRDEYNIIFKNVEDANQPMDNEPKTSSSTSTAVLTS